MNKWIEVVKSDSFLQEWVYETEKRLSRTLFHLADRKKSIRVWWKELKGDSTIQSNRLSVVIGDTFEDTFTPILKSYGINCVHIDDSNGDFKIEGVVWELKTSKHNPKAPSGYTLQGSTHSASKSNNYIFLRYGIDWNKPINYIRKPNNIINQIHFSAHEEIVTPDFWSGDAKNNNSRTKLKVPIAHISNFRKGLIYGEVAAAVKYIQFKPQKFSLNPIGNSLKDIIQ